MAQPLPVDCCVFDVTFCSISTSSEFFKTQSKVTELRICKEKKENLTFLVMVRIERSTIRSFSIILNI